MYSHVWSTQCIFEITANSVESKEKGLKHFSTIWFSQNRTAKRKGAEDLNKKPQLRSHMEQISWMLMPALLKSWMWRVFCWGWTMLLFRIQHATAGLWIEISIPTFWAFLLKVIYVNCKLLSNSNRTMCLSFSEF